MSHPTATPATTNSGPQVTATYTLTSDPTPSSSLTFQHPIQSPTDAPHTQYLTALAQALSTLQDQINLGLTERLVQQGVLNESNTTTAKGADGEEINTKLRTKIPGQTNTKLLAKQAEAKEQRKQEQILKGQAAREKKAAARALALAQAQEAQVQVGAAAASVAAGSTTQPAGVEGISLESEAMEVDEEEEEEEEEDENAGKDEVDLVMEADPGEVDGACLELPKEQQAASTAAALGSSLSSLSSSQQDSKKRNGVEVDVATKKPKGSDL